MAEALALQQEQLTKAWRKRLEDEYRNYGKELQRAYEAREKDRIENQKALDKQKKQLEDNFQKKLEDWAIQIAKEYNLAKEDAQKVFNALEEFYGLPDGSSTRLMTAWFKYITDRAKIDVVVNTIINPPTGGGVTNPCPAGSHYSQPLRACVPDTEPGAGQGQNLSCGGMSACPNGQYRNPDNGCRCEGTIIPPQPQQPNCLADEFWNGFSCQKISDVIGGATAGTPPDLSSAIRSAGGNNIAIMASSQQAMTMERKVGLRFENSLRIEGPGVTDSQADAMADQVMRSLAGIIRSEVKS